MTLLVRYGVAVGDVNGDGLDDLYVCQPGGLPNRLYVQNADGTATDRSREAGVDWLDLSVSALLVDLDNDGDQDLVIVTDHRLLVSSNDGTGHFKVSVVVEIAANGPDHRANSLAPGIPNTLFVFHHMTSFSKNYGRPLGENRPLYFQTKRRD